MTLKHYRAELYAGIYLNRLHPSISSQLRGSLLSRDHVPGITTIFSAALRVTTSMPSLPLSSTLSNTPPPSTMAILLLELATMVVSLPALMAIVLLVAATFFRHVLTAARKPISPTSVGSNSASLLLPKRF